MKIIPTSEVVYDMQLEPMEKFKIQLLGEFRDSLTKEFYENGKIETHTNLQLKCT